MASLHARHSRKCPLSGKWTAVPKKGPIPDCDCLPTYYVVAERDEQGKLVRERIGRDRQNAERALRKIGTQVDEGVYQGPKNIGFDAWGDQWIASLERKGTTTKGYRSTIEYAKTVFKSKNVRQLGTEDIGRFNKHLGTIRVRRNGEKVPLTASTRAKHLRVLGICLNSAVRHKYAAANPVKEIPKGEKPRPQKKESAYFTDDELPRLMAEITEGAFRTLCMGALKTGMREGELIALEVTDLSLIDGVARVRRTRTDGIVHEPKNHEKRDVDLTDEVVDMFGAWLGEIGNPTEGLVFPGDGRDGYIVPTTLLKRELYPAMERAGIPRVGPTGEDRTFHSLRHTFARIALEHGAELTWLSRHLGHSSTAITDGVYGHWSREARKRAMENLAGAFTV